MSTMGTQTVSIRQKIKNAFNSLADMRFRDGFNAIARLGAEAIAAAVNYAGGYELYKVLSNPNLKISQKIFPSIGYGLGILVGVPAVILLIAGAGMLVPPFMFAASVIAVVRNVGTYLEERAERNNLRKELITSKELVGKIQKANLSDVNKTQILHSLLGQRHIYLDLYALRDSIIKSSQIAFEEKQRLVGTVNGAIEKFSKGELQQLDIDKQLLPESVRETLSTQIDKLNTKIQYYNSDLLAIKQMNLPKSLQQSIEIYKYTQENVYSQDLPLNIKQEMVSMLEGKKIHRIALNDLYLRIGQHHLNSTPLEQLKVQDDNRRIKLMNFIKNETELKNCEAFYQKPREVYAALYTLQDIISHHDFGVGKEQEKAQLIAELKKFISTFKQNPSLSERWLSTFQEKFSHIDPRLQPAMQKAFEELRAYDDVAKRYYQSSLFTEQRRLQQLVNPSSSDQNKLANIHDITQSLEDHQLNSLQQFSSQYGQQFNSPQIQIDHNKYDLVASMAAKIDEKWNISARLKRIGKAANTRALKKLFNASSMPKWEAQEQVSDEKAQLKDNFKERYNNTFVLMEKKQRLRYLEKSVPRRLLNVGIASVVALASLATTFLIPAIASPAAPAAATATVVIGAITTALVVTSAVNSADLIRKELQAKMKVEEAKKNIKDAIVPSLGERPQQQAVNHELPKQNLGASSEPILPLESMAVHTNHRSMHEVLMEEVQRHSKLQSASTTTKQQVGAQSEDDKEHTTRHP